MPLLPNVFHTALRTCCFPGRRWRKTRVRDDAPCPVPQRGPPLDQHESQDARTRRCRRLFARRREASSRPSPRKPCMGAGAPRAAACQLRQTRQGGVCAPARLAPAGSDNTDGDPQRQAARRRQRARGQALECTKKQKPDRRAGGTSSDRVERCRKRPGGTRGKGGRGDGIKQSSSRQARGS